MKQCYTGLLRMYSDIEAILTGCTEHHLITLDDGKQIHRQMLADYLQLQQAAAMAGIQLGIVSAFRSFQHQARIWQEKCDGLRPVYNLQQQRLDISRLQGYEKLSAILLYSALPGASRHHWGTELDIYDKAAVPADYRPQLLAAEYAEDGPFYPMLQWLERYAASFGFFFPYQHYQGGIAAEPWHLSYKPLARHYTQLLTLNRLETCLRQRHIAEQDNVLYYLIRIYQQFVIRAC